MQRYEVINRIIRIKGYKRYLEIGTQADVCLKRVECVFKVGVDPEPHMHDSLNSNQFHKMKSDEFFQRNKHTFDIIFIDGLHHSKQVGIDIKNSLKILEQGGTIVVHDCNPRSEESQKVPYMHMGSWNGDVWKAWMYFRSSSRLKSASSV